MAVFFSKNQLNYARKKFYGKFYVIKDDLNLIDKLINKSLIYIYLIKYSLVNFKRKILRFVNVIFRGKINDNLVKFSINLDDRSIGEISNDLKTKNFSFIENFLSEESYQYLIKNWPDINYFNHNKQIIKHYNSKREWPTKGIFSKFNSCSELEKFFSYLLSNEFQNFYNKLINFENKDYQICAISSSMAARDSYLIPHIDGVIKNKQKFKNYNFIYFIDGYDKDPSLGGGTGFYKDNEFQLPIFIPKTIKNSIVIYNQTEEFYHGFKTIKSPKDIYRKTVNFQIKPVSAN